MELDSSSHPYGTGRYLLVVLHGEAFTVRVKKAFHGTPGLGFTNSCTVLIEATIELTKHLADMSGVIIVGKYLVLKSFDSKFSQTPRQGFHCNASETSSPGTSKAQYINLYDERLPNELLSLPLLQEFVQFSMLSDGATYGHAIMDILSDQNYEERSITEGFLERAITSQEREQYVRAHCQSLFKHEKAVLETTQAAGTTILPRLLATGEVHASSMNPAMTDSRDLDSPVLFLEFLPGKPLTQWARDYYVDLEDNSDNVKVSKDIMAIGSQLFHHLHALMCCGLAPVDIRPDNINVHQASQNEPPFVRFFDAGASFLVPSYQTFLSLDPPVKLNPLTRAANQFSAQFFTPLTEQYGCAVLDDIAWPPRRTLSYTSTYKYLATGCFENPVKQTDTIYWRVIMFGLWYCLEVKIALEALPQTLSILRGIRIVLHSVLPNLDIEFQNPTDSYWPFTGLAKISYGFFYEEDFSAAVKLMANEIFSYFWNLERRGVNDLDDYYFSNKDLPLRICHSSTLFRWHAWENRDRLDSVPSMVTTALKYQPNIEHIKKIVNAAHDKFPTTLLNFEKDCSMLPLVDTRAVGLQPIKPGFVDDTADVDYSNRITEFKLFDDLVTEVGVTLKGALAAGK